RADVIIDGLIGVGLRGALRGATEQAVRAINENKERAAIVSIDIPSGVNADNGEVSGAAVIADVTVTFACPRWGHFLFPGADRRGELVARDIGIPEWTGEALGFSSRLLTDKMISELIPSRPRHSHKGTFGHVLIVSGSRSYAGAPVL